VLGEVQVRVEQRVLERALELPLGQVRVPVEQRVLEQPLGQVRQELGQELLSEWVLELLLERALGQELLSEWVQDRVELGQESLSGPWALGFLELHREASHFPLGLAQEVRLLWFRRSWTRSQSSPERPGDRSRYRP
jgi:hypothetical protein